MENKLEHWRQELLRFVYKHFGRQSIAEDVAQEAIARYLECIAQGQEIEHPRGWLFRTARNLSVDHVRRRLPYQVGLELMQQVPDPHSVPEETSQIQIGSKEMDQSIVLEGLPRAMKQLPDHYQRNIYYRYHKQVGCAEYAKIEGIKVDAMKAQSSRARRCLRRILEQNLLEGRSSC